MVMVMVRSRASTKMRRDSMSIVQTSFLGAEDANDWNALSAGTLD